MNKSDTIEKLTLFKTPEESPGYLLWHVSLAWRSFIEETLKPLDLTHPQFVVLATTAWLTRGGNHINQIDISKASGLDQNTTSQILRGLEAKNFIKRTRSLNERSKNPILTELGSKVLSKALPAVEKSDSQFFELLASKEMDMLIKIFQKIIPK
ncbi:MAG: MarR family transcriptional regulator [Candidatus Babeliaceae bacterium]